MMIIPKLNRKNVNIYSCLSFGATYYYCLLKLKRKVHMNLQLLTIEKTGNNRGNIHFRTHRSEKNSNNKLIEIWSAQGGDFILILYYMHMYASVQELTYLM